MITVKFSYTPGLNESFDWNVTILTIHMNHSINSMFIYNITSFPKKYM